MSLSEQRKKGLGGLAVLVIVAGFMWAAIFIVSALLQVEFIDYLYKTFLGSTITVKLFIKQVDEGTKVNTFLLLDKGSGPYADLLAFQAAKDFRGDMASVRRTLNALYLSLVIIDGTGKTIFSEGDVRDLEGKFIDFALPGLKRGKMGIDLPPQRPQI